MSYVKIIRLIFIQTQTFITYNSASGCTHFTFRRFWIHTLPEV
jgi:hypothetical protein